MIQPIIHKRDLKQRLNEARKEEMRSKATDEKSASRAASVERVIHAPIQLGLTVIRFADTTFARVKMFGHLCADVPVGFGRFREPVRATLVELA